MAVKTGGHLGIVAPVCREIDLAGEIARIVGVDPRQKVTLRRGGFCQGPERLGFVDQPPASIPSVHGNKASGVIDNVRG